jgi:hypothetical protein
MLCHLLCNGHSNCARLEHLMRASFSSCFVALGVLIVLLALSYRGIVGTPSEWV